MPVLPHLRPRRPMVPTKSCSVSKSFRQTAEATSPTRPTPKTSANGQQSNQSPGPQLGQPAQHPQSGPQPSQQGQQAFLGPNQSRGFTGAQRTGPRSHQYRTEPYTTQRPRNVRSTITLGRAEYDRIIEERLIEQQDSECKIKSIQEYSKAQSLAHDTEIARIKSHYENILAQQSAAQHMPQPKAEQQDSAEQWKQVFMAASHRETSLNMIWRSRKLEF